MGYISLRSNDLDHHSTDDRLKGNNKKNILNEKNIMQNTVNKNLSVWEDGTIAVTKSIHKVKCFLLKRGRSSYILLYCYRPNIFYTKLMTYFIL